MGQNSNLRYNDIPGLTDGNAVDRAQNISVYTVIKSKIYTRFFND